MQIFKSSKQHVAVIMMLEICFSLTNEISCGHVDENITAVDLLDNIKTETTKVYNDTNESTLKNNITESKTCINCSLSARDIKNVEENCSISRGWNLKGSDWGCCGNYPGCCTFASFICYIHDALCKCCDVGGTFCGPTCKPEVSCASYTADKIKNNNCADKILNFTNTTHENQEHFNVDYVDAMNQTDSRNNTQRNFFLRGRAVSGSEDNVSQDGGDCEEGSGEIDS